MRYGDLVEDREGDKGTVQSVEDGAHRSDGMTVVFVKLDCTGRTARYMPNELTNLTERVFEESPLSRDAAAKFCRDIEQNEGSLLADEDLHALAIACLMELRYRVPLDAVRQGDLPEDEYGQMARARRELAEHVAEADIFVGWPKIR
jgi:hypothetical protein